jgi:hypothetical protein
MRGTKGMRDGNRGGVGRKGGGKRTHWLVDPMCKEENKKRSLSKGVYESSVGVGRKIGTSNLDEMSSYG